MVKKRSFFSCNRLPNSFFKSFIIIICLFSAFYYSTIFPAVVSGGLKGIFECPEEADDKFLQVKKIVALSSSEAFIENGMCDNGYKNDLAVEKDFKCFEPSNNGISRADKIIPLGCGMVPIQAFNAAVKGIKFWMEHPEIVQAVFSGFAAFATYISSKFSSRSKIDSNCGSGNMQPVFPNDPNDKNKKKIDKKNKSWGREKRSKVRNNSVEKKERIVNTVEKSEFFNNPEIKNNYRYDKDKVYVLKKGGNPVCKGAERISWDNMHNEIEVYKGKVHLGALDPKSKTIYKAAKLGRRPFQKK